MLSALALSLSGQETTGSLVGVVRDSSGSVVTGAQITVTRNDTGTESRTTSDDQGNYQFLLLRAGTYRVTAELQGFQKLQRDNVVINTTERTRVDLALSVGSVTETVSVTAETPLLQSEKVTIGQVVEQRTIQSIPLATRNFTQILGTSAGVVGAIFNADNPGTGSDSVSVNGGRRGSNNLLVDGVPTTNPLNNAPDGDGTPSIEFLSEFKVLTSLYSSEYGRNLGSVINVTTRSGSNNWHGSAYEFLRNTALNARPFFNPVRGQNNQNQFGANISGPARIPGLLKGKDRSFFFAGWESSRQLNANSGAASILRVVPTVGMRNGDFTGRRIINDPSTGTPFAGNVIPTSRINAVSKAIQDQFIPQPNFSAGANNFFAARSIATNIDQYTFRIDHRISDKDTIFGRWFESWQKDISPFGAGLPGFGQNANRQKHSGNVTYTRVWSAAHVLEARFGFDNSDQFISFENAVDPKSLGFRPLPVTLIQGMPRVDIVNYVTFGNTNNWTDLIKRYTAGATMTWAKSKHNIRYGAEWQMQPMNPQNAQESRGSWRYDGSASSDEYADFLLSQPRLKTFAAGPGQMHMRDNVVSLFINDDWKVTDRLTVNAGMRYEAHFHPGGTDLDFVSFWPQRYKGLGTLESSGMIQARRGDIPPTTIFGDWNNIAPRLGIAYRPSNNWVIRTGAGLFYDLRTGQTAQAFFGNPPVFARVTVDCRIAGQGCSMNTPDNWTFVDPGYDAKNIPFPTRPTDALSLGAIEPNTKTDNAWQYNFSLQRQLPRNVLLEAAYVGTKGTHLIARRNLNPLVPLAGGGLQRAFPGFGDISATGQNGASTFHSFQFTFRQRVGTANIQAAYTLGKTIGNGDDGARFQTNIFRTPWNDFSRAKGPANFDRRQRLALTFVQDLPNKFAGGAGKFLFNNWSFNGFLVTQTGNPITVINSTSGLDLGGIATDVAGAFMSDVIAGAALTTSGNVRQRLTNFINKDAWIAAPRNRYGNSGRGMFYGPGQTSLDVSVFKDFKFRERMNLQFRTEFFNMLNLPNFGNPQASMNSAAFGQISSTSVNARLIQFALKLTF